MSRIISVNMDGSSAPPTSTSSSAAAAATGADGPDRAEDGSPPSGLDDLPELPEMNDMDSGLNDMNGLSGMNGLDSADNSGTNNGFELDMDMMHDFGAGSGLDMRDFAVHEVGEGLETVTEEGSAGKGLKKEPANASAGLDQPVPLVPSASVTPTLNLPNGSSSAQSYSAQGAGRSETHSHSPAQASQHSQSVTPVPSGSVLSNGLHAATLGGMQFQEETGLSDDDDSDGDDDEPRGSKRSRQTADVPGGFTYVTDKDGEPGRRKIRIEYITDKSRRHITFSKRKAGIMKKAYELSILTGTQVLLLVVSETGLVYTFTTSKLQPLVQKPEGKNLIQACLSAPDGLGPDGEPLPAGPMAPSKGKNGGLAIRPHKLSSATTAALAATAQAAQAAHPNPVSANDLGMGMPGGMGMGGPGMPGAPPMGHGLPSSSGTDISSRPKKRLPSRGGKKSTADLKAEAAAQDNIPPVPSIPDMHRQRSPNSANSHLMGGGAMGSSPSYHMPVGGDYGHQPPPSPGQGHVHAQHGYYPPPPAPGQEYGYHPHHTPYGAPPPHQQQQQQQQYLAVHPHSGQQQGAGSQQGPGGQQMDLQTYQSQARENARRMMQLQGGGAGGGMGQHGHGHAHGGHQGQHVGVGMGM